MANRKLLHQGILPPSLVLRKSRISARSCHWLPVKVFNRRHLNLYSVDIARAPDGQWLALSDRTQSSEGAGYVLENRIVLSRTFPDIFKACQVQRLALFFRKMGQALTELAPHNRDNPRIVLLTPGPLNETYFEHAYLARYLNYTLAEGGDLTVRDSCLYLKTLGGLHRVDVVLRRLKAEFGVPLELRADSLLGVAGLVQAARAGNVAIANTLGTGVLETPALNAFLPALCRYLLKEDLLIPAVNTYWCGKPEWMERALSNLSKMVIKLHVLRLRHCVRVLWKSLGDRALQSLCANSREAGTVCRAGTGGLLHELLVLQGRKFRPWQAALRTFLVAALTIRTLACRAA